MQRVSFEAVGNRLAGVALLHADGRVPAALGYVAVDEVEAGLALGVYEAAHVLTHGTRPERMGQLHRGNSPYRVFRTRDGWITIGANKDAFWRALCGIVGRPELAEDPRFAAADAAFAASDFDTAVAEYEKLQAQYPADTEVSERLAGVRLLARTQGADLQAARKAAADAPDELDAQMLVAEVCGQLLARGMEVPVLVSANVPGGDEHNEELNQRYGGRVRRSEP